MRMNLRHLSAASLACAVMFASCKKNDSQPPTDTESAKEIQAHAEDQHRVSADLDEIANDVNMAIETNSDFGGRYLNGQNINNVCHASATADINSNPKKITVTYNGNNCVNTHHRSGTVVLSMPAGVKWKDAGAAITVTFQNLRIKRLADNKSITLNGSQTITNVSGGLLGNLSNLQQIVHTITSNNMTIGFNDTTQRVWNIARKRVFTYDNGAVMTVHGIGTNVSITNAAEWGSNRFGHSFTTSISEPLVIRQDCSFRLTAGEIKHHGFGTATVKFGLDANGNPTACPNGKYYSKLTWTGPGGFSHSVILPY